MHTPDGHRVWCSAELQFIGDVGSDERFLRSTVEKTVDQPLLPVLTVGHRLNDRQEDPGSPNSRGEVDPDRSELMTMGVLGGKQRVLTWSFRILLAAPSTVPFSQTSKTQPVFPDTLPSFRPGEFDESRATLDRMDSAAHHAVSDWIHLYGGRHETLSLFRPPF
ncbi:hypothetical protein T08_4255, partial [Trichinella sp. T8]